MRKRIWKRLAALAMSLVMTAALLPTVAYAAIGATIGAGDKAAILEQLEAITGSEQSALELYTRLNALGVLDGDQWVTESLVINGETYTLEEAEALAATLPDSQLVQVGDTSITVGDLKIMLEIEREIARIRDLYSTEDWTQAQLAYIESLREALSSGDFVVETRSAGSGVGPSGVNHAARVSLTNNGDGSFTATLTGAAEGQTVAFDWQALSGSQTVGAGASGTMELNAANNYTKTVKIPLGEAEGVHSTANPVYYVNFSDLEGALFADNGLTASSMKMESTPTYTSFSPYGAFNFSNRFIFSVGSGNPSTANFPLTDDQSEAIRLGIIDTATVSQTSLGAAELTEDVMKYLKYEGTDNEAWYYQSVSFSAEFNGKTAEGKIGYFSPDYTYTNQPTAAFDVTKTDSGAVTLGGRNMTEIVPTKSSASPLPEGGSVTVQVDFTDSRPPEVEAVSAPSGTFYFGQVVPVAATFSCPVTAATAVINGIEVPAVLTGGASNVAVFPYPVQGVDGTSLTVTSISAADLSGNRLTGHNPGGADAEGLVLQGPVLSTADPAHAVERLSVSPEAPLPSDTEITVTAAIRSGYETILAQRSLSLYASCDGGTTLTEMTPQDEGATYTCALPIGENTTEDAKTGQVELFLGPEGYTPGSGTAPELCFGYLAAYTQAAPVYLEEGDFQIVTGNWPADTIYADHELPLTVAVRVTGTEDYTWGNPGNPDHFRWGVEIQSGTDEGGQPVWTSENAAAVASVALEGNDPSRGTVALLGAGTFRVTLTASNGGWDTAEGPVGGADVTVYSSPVTVGLGSNPTLTIQPSLQRVSVKSGDAAILYWTSNLAQKNDEVGPGAEMTFTIRVYEYEGHDYQAVQADSGALERPDFSGSGWKKVDEIGLTATAAAPVSSCSLPGLTALSVGGGFSYGVEISAVFDGRTYTAFALVSVTAKPAVVELDAPILYYTESSAAGGVPLTWTVRNFDALNDADFQLVVTNNDTGRVLASGDGMSYLKLQSDSGTYTGSYTLKFDALTGGNYRETYTVELRARNDPGSTWSYDSAVLYLYSDAAFQIYIDGQAAEDSHTMSNETNPVDGAEKSIAQMTPAEIIALNRSISLADKLSINPNVPWGAVSDQVVWENSNPDSATINYRQGTLYEDIRRFSYESYSPSTEFILSGLQTGETTVSASHKAAGDVLNDQVSIRVETLADKLYLFQIAPVNTTDPEQNVLEYYDAEGNKKTATADANGMAAIYEPDGIHSDVYCRTVVNETTYVGTFYLETLLTGETDSTQLQLYPLNTLKLREAATAQLYLKDENGEPYAGKSLTIHAGVYKNGTYCPDAKFTLEPDGSGMVPGDGDGFEATTDESGKLTIYMNVDEFYTAAETESDDRALQADDRLAFLFEVEMTGDGTTYYPQLLQLDGMASQSDTVRFGKSIVSLRRNDRDEAHPYAVIQTADFGAGGSANLIGYTGKVGPGQSNPVMDLETTVLWWGEEAAQNWDLAYYDSVGARLPNQSITNTKYEFTDTLVTRSTVHLDAAAMRSWLPSLTSRSLELRYYDGSGNVVRTEPQTFRMVNMVDALTPDQDEAAQENIKKLLLALLSSMGSKGDGEIGVDDALLGAGFALVGGTGMDFSGLKLSLYGTEDPTVFRGLFSIAYGNAESAVELSEGINTEKMDIAKNLVSANARKQTKDSLMGALADLKTGTGLLGGFGVSGKEFGGYIESEICFEDGQWHIYVLNGGFNAGIGLEYMWRINSWLGPVPVTAEFALGGSVAVSLDVGVDRINDLNYYLTNLQIGAYFRAFGGLGFDFSIIALKIGLFGNLNLYYNARFFNVSDQSRSPYQNMIGHSLEAGGQVGIEFYAKFIFVSYRTILASFEFTLANETFGKWDEINETWEQVGKGVSGTGGVISGGTLSASQVYYDARTGQTLYASPTVAAMESRDYLNNGGRQWNPLRISLFSLDEQAAVDTTLTNAYPNMDPLVTEDGQVMVYLDDMESPDVSDTRAAFSLWDGSKFQAGDPIDNGEDSGYGDSQLAAAGTGEFAVAAWVRLNADPGADAGETMTATDQAAMMNSTDIVAAVYKDGSWEAESLTEDAAPDLAPAVAAAGGKAIVAWRSVASTDMDSLTRFDAGDSILYKTYDGSEWSETKTLYNGTSGAVKGLEAAMLADGTAALVYSIDTNDRPIAQDGSQTYTRSGQTAQDNTGLEIVYAVIDDAAENSTAALTEGADDAAAANVRLTYDSQLDENPQITTAAIGGEEHFIIGWNRTEQADEDGTTGQDVALRAVDRTGRLRSDLPDSVAEMARGDGVGITSNFRFSRGASSIDEHSILWVEPLSGGETVTDDGMTVDRDRLMAVKFVENRGQSGEAVSYGITVPMEMALMPEYTTINHFDACLQQGDSPDLRAVILGTNYGGGYSYYLVNADGTTQETEAGTEGAIAIADSEVRLYTATGSYANAVSIDRAEYEAAGVVPGFTLPVQLTVTNRGIDPISELTVAIGGKTVQTVRNLSLAPGQSLTFTVNYTVPSPVTDVDCTVTAVFPDGGEKTSEPAALALSTPDVGISRMELVGQQDGLRTVQVALYNDGEVPLAGSEHTVKVALFSDAACEHQIAAPVVLEDADLEMVNDGGYTTQLTFDVETAFADALQEGEIPEGGLQIYAKVWIEAKQSLGTRLLNLLDGDAEPEVLADTRMGNDVRTLTVTSLLEQSSGAAASVTSVLSNSDAGTSVTVTVQNNSLSQTSSGNLIVTLLDENGQVLAQQQSYDTSRDDKGLIALGPEEIDSRTFTFTQTGARVEVTYSNAVLADDNANLDTVKLEGVELTYQESTGTYTGATGASDALLTLVPENPGAAITVNGAPYTQAMRVTLSVGGSLTIQVTSADESETRQYTLAIADTSAPVDPGSGTGGGSGGTSYAPVLEIGDGGAVTARPGAAQAGDTVTLTVSPDQGYRLDRLTVTDRNGREVAVTDHGDGTFTFEQPRGRVTVTAVFAPAGQDPANPFVDVAAGTYYHDAVLWAVANGITSGTSAATFSPDSPCTRAQAVTFLWRSAGSPAPRSTDMPFTDVPEDAYYRDAVAWAVENSITNGTSAATFSPSSPCTRAQIVTFLHRRLV